MVMIRLHAAVGLTFALWGCVSSSSTAVERRGEPVSVTVQEPPVPKPWTPPKTTLPASLVKWTAFLLEHGMDDPRGGTYREASVVVGSV